MNGGHFPWMAPERFTDGDNGINGDSDNSDDGDNCDNSDSRICRGASAVGDVWSFAMTMLVSFSHL